MLEPRVLRPVPESDQLSQTQTTIPSTPVAVPQKKNLSNLHHLRSISLSPIRSLIIWSRPHPLLLSQYKPPKSVSITTDTSINNGSIQNPKSYPDTTTTITPYTGTNIDSSYTTDSTSTCAEVDFTKICSGCNNPFSNCYEGKWRKICLHRVLDYLEEKDFDGVSERSVWHVYYKIFLLMMKAEILGETDFYELEDHIHLPECMKWGSLNEALEMMQFDTA